MAKKNFIMLSLEDEKIKKISNVISNDSCRKILDHLAEKESTESELSKKLNIPISTVHYNLQQLMQTGLVSADEYHYSEKGKEVNHYKLANKYIIIAPKKATGLKEKLRSILPVALIVSGAALVLQYTKKFFSYGGSMSTFTQTKQTLVRETYSQAVGKAAVVAQDELRISAGAAMEEAAAAQQAVVADTSQEIINKTTEYLLDPEVVTQTVTNPPSLFSNIALWFFIGAIFGLLIYLIINLFRKD